MHEAGIEPDWIVGTSIGPSTRPWSPARRPRERLDRLGEFWRRVEHADFNRRGLAQLFSQAARNMLAVTRGVPAFFEPNPAAFFSAHAPLGAEGAGYYSVAPLGETLSELIDFERINAGAMRLTVGASNVRTSEMTYSTAATRRWTCVT